MRKRRIRILSRENFIIVITGFLIFFLGVQIFKVLLKNKYEAEHKQLMAQNIEDIDQLANQDINGIQNKIDELNKEKKVEAIEKDTGEKNYKTLFKNTIFMGDSISEGFQEYNFINKYNVLAEKGETVLKAKDYIDTLVSINPQNIVMLFGMNDVSYYDAPDNNRGIDNFQKDYEALINEVKEKLPKANIYIESPLPVQEKAVNFEKEATIANLDKIRLKAEEAAKATGVTYVDIKSMALDHDELHEGDGIHYKYDFYPFWLNYLLKIINL